MLVKNLNNTLQAKPDVIVQTDHKPLENIFQKSILSAPKRIQRMMLRLLKYSLKVEYIKGSKMSIADALSRLIPAENQKKETPTEISEIYCINRFEQARRDVEQINITEYKNIKDDTLQEIRDETTKDKNLQALTKFITNGWPTDPNAYAEVSSYHPYKDELTIQNSIIF